MNLLVIIIGALLNITGYLSVFLVPESTELACLDKGKQDTKNLNIIRTKKA